MTKPTRLQELACDKLVDALLLVAEASRLDGKGKLKEADWDELGRRVTNVSSAFDLEQIVSRALEKRGRALGLRSGTAELLTLLDSDRKPLAMLLLSDEDFRALVDAMEQELGEV